MLFFHAQASQCETTVTISIYEKPMYVASTCPEIREFPNNADTGIFCFITGHSQYTCDLWGAYMAYCNWNAKTKCINCKPFKTVCNTIRWKRIFNWWNYSILFCKVCEVKHLRALGNVNKRKVSQLLLKETEVCLFSNFHIFFTQMRMTYW